MTGHSIRSCRSLFLGISLLPLLLAGCADSMPEVAYFSPWVREQWAEDEKEITTYHRRVADLASLRSQVGRLNAEQQESAATELAQRLKDESSPVMRAELVRTLGEFSASIATSTVAASLADESGHVRVAACRALARQPSAQGFQALSKAVADDSDLDVRIAAAHALREFRDQDAPESLRAALDDNDPALQMVAMQSLQSLTGRTQYGNSVATWREYLDGNDPAPPPGPSLADRLQQLRYWY